MRKQTKLVAALSATALLAVGASMTSFAAGWTEIGDGEYVYLDSDGERITSEWRRSGSDYFFLDENGEVAKSKLITPNDGDTDAYYYVNSVGARLKNQWVRVMNDEGETVNDEEPEMFWYYLGTNGKAYRCDDGGVSDFKKYSINYAGKNRTFFFDTEGRMVTGWIIDYEEKDGNKNNYYCTPDDPAGGYALTDWQELEVPDDWDSAGDEYDVVEWFNFDGNGKARRASAAGTPKVWYSNGWYYSFDENGVMLDDWYDSALATSNTISATNANAETFSSYYGTKQGSGWVYTDKNDDGEYDYYYLVTYRDRTNEKKNVPFNSFADDENPAMMRAKSINGKIYLFDTDGTMKDGRQILQTKDKAIDGADGTVDNRSDRTWGGVPFKELEAGTYYFNKGNGVKGQMMYGKQTFEKDGETYHYYFDKKTGRAVTNAVVDGCYYGPDGDMVKADDGNPTAIVEVRGGDVAIRKGSSGTVTEYIAGGSYVIVTSNGKLKTSTNGYTKVDGDQYKVTKTDAGKKDGVSISTWGVDRKND